MLNICLLGENVQGTWDFPCVSCYYIQIYSQNSQQFHCGKFASSQWTVVDEWYRNSDEVHCTRLVVVVETNLDRKVRH